jgi:hypothetical protein
MNENQPPSEQESPEERNASPSDAPSQGGTPSSEPEWLRDMSGDQEPPEWLRRLFEEQPAGADQPPLEERDDAPPEERDDAPPEGRDEAPSAAEPIEPAEPGPRHSQTDELRQWFREAEGEPEERPDREELPEWLQALDVDERSSEPAEAGEEGEIPSWLRDLGEGEKEPARAEPEELPDWLRDLDDGAADGEETPAPAGGAPTPAAQDVGDLPDWLIEMSEEVAGEPESAERAAPEEAAEELLAAAAPSLPKEPPIAPEPAEDAALPVEAALGAEAAAAPLAETDQPAEPAEEAARDQEPPLWLTELDREPPKEMPPTEELPAAEVLPEPGPEDEVAVPDWLAEVDEQAVEGAEAPEWMQDLRGEPEGEAEPEPELEVETSGPLAGLSGLLTPQPLAGLSSRATFKPAPAIPQEHHVLAARVQELLSEPPARPELTPAAPERSVMRALGHWLIYLALVAVIVAAMFVPALQDLVLAPETDASKDLYVTLLALPPGSEVLLVVDYDAAHDGELTPLARVLLWHLVTTGQRVAVVSHTPQGTALAEDLLADRALWAYGPAPAPGEQVLNLGYLPPHPASMQAFMADPLGGAALWGEGGRARDTSLGQAISRFDDLDAMVLVSASQQHTRFWIEQTAGAMPTVAAVSASIAPTLLPYYGSTGGAQLGGMLVGLGGAAEYERLSGAGFVPNARQNMILQGGAQMLLTAIVLVSAISLVARRAFGRKG